MQEIIKGDPAILKGLEELCPDPGAVRHTTDSFSNSYYWFNLPLPDALTRAADILGQGHARLAMITAWNPGPRDSGEKNLCYEFVISGVVYSLTVHLDATHDSVPSIARKFPNADWHEREMMELYGIKISNQPNPRRLFLDETLDQGLLGEIVPLSIMMNGANSTDLWERILADKERNQ